MNGVCLPENKDWFKKKITVFSYVYTTLPHLTAFDSFIKNQEDSYLADVLSLSHLLSSLSFCPLFLLYFLYFFVKVSETVAYSSKL
jgi:hypothetical protein